MVERFDRLGPDAGDVEQLQQGRGDLGQQFPMGLDGACSDEFLDLGQRGLADPWSFGQLAAVEQGRHVRGHLADHSRDRAVAVDAESVLAEDFHHVGHLREDRADRGIVHDC